jgi:alkylation response protein AidB-like acyl-CoA dehydrogenase
MDFSKEVRTPKRLAPILARIDRLYEREVEPREQALEHRLTDSRLYLDEDGRLHPELWQARREIMRAAGRAGVYSLHLPKEIGGGGLGRHDMIFAEEHVYRLGVGLNPALLSWSEGATPRLIWCGPHQRERYVDPLVKGRYTSLHGVTEPQAGSNFFDFTTSARRTRKGTWKLNGHKAFITNAFEADVAQILCVTDPGKGRRSFTYFQLLTKDHRGKGFRTGRVFQTMWGDGITGEFVLDDLELSDDDMIGERGQGFEIAMSSINWTRMRRGGMCSGWAMYLMERTIERLHSRVVGGKPLAANQGLQWMVADMYTDWLATRALSLQVAAEIDEPGPWWKMPRPKEEIRRICAVKLANDEAFHRIADRAVQLHGGAGMMKDNPVNKIALIARNLRVPGGSDEVQRTTIAQTLGFP